MSCWFLLAAALLASPLRAGASEPPAYVPWYNQGNATGDCVVESHDPLFNGAAIALLDRLQGQLLPPPAPAAPGAPPPPSPSPAGPATRLLLRVEAPVPGAAPRPPALTARRYREGEKDHVDFQVTVWPGPGVSGEAWQRLAVEGLLRRRALAHGAPLPEVGGALAPIPRWIVEGAFQSGVVQREQAALDDGRVQLYGKIARRAGFLRTTPPVAAVAGWTDLSADPILGPWQEAFCWYLTLFYQADPARSAALERWFDPAQPLLPGPDGKVPERIEADWTAFQKTIGEGMGDIVYSWDRSAGELASAQSVFLPGDEKAKPPRAPLVLKLPQLAEAAAKGYPEFPAAVQAKISALQLLEMKANFAWRPVVALYRDALAALVADYPAGTVSPTDEAWQKKLRAWNPERHADEFKRRLALADRAAARLSGLNQQVDDYLNWFEVTRKTRDGRSPFADYFDLSGEFDFLESRRRAGGPGSGAAN